MTTNFKQNTLSFKQMRDPDVSTVFIDFDGTIADHDVTDELLTHFAAKEWEALEADWLSGKIGARECMAKQISLLKATPEALNACLDTMTIDPSFVTFIAMLKRQNISVAIVSDGLDYSIRHILKKHGLDDIQVFANHLVYDGQEKWTLEFPYKNQGCPSGHCKCRRYDNLAPGFNVYIGDGASDYCPAEKANMVLAKGKLATYCSNKQISHIKVDSFMDVVNLWPTLQYETQQLMQVAS